MRRIAYGWLIMMFTTALVCEAHVQILAPVNDGSIDDHGATVQLDIRFVGHAVDNGPLLDMQPPVQFGVMLNGRRLSLLEQLESKSAAGAGYFEASHAMEEAGAHVYFLEPAPYVDDEEGAVIVHYTKVVLDSTAAGLRTESAMGWENWEGWDQMIGFPVEIEPYIQPTSLWTNSAFRGRVLKDGEPAAYVRIEVEYLDREGTIELPSNAFKTQILKSDADGEFAFTPVKAGWWAMTALIETGEDIQAHDGNEYEAEIGGVLWIHATDMK